MTMMLTPFLALAAIGLVLSLIVHVSALAGLQQPLGPAAWGLHVGVFVVWLPAILVCNRMTEGFKRKDQWNTALRGCPNWMRGLVYVFFLYAVLNFLFFMAQTLLVPPPPRDAAGDAAASPEVFRGYSAYWMALYSSAAAILYSAIVVSR
jgi:hypothetical protein